MKRIVLSCISFIVLSAPVMADTSATGPLPYAVPARTSYHDTQAQLLPRQPAVPPPNKKSGSGDFVEYFSVPVPGGTMQSSAPPPGAIMPQNTAGPNVPPAYGYAPDFIPNSARLDINNTYTMQAYCPFPFGIANYAPAFDNYSSGTYGYPYGAGFGYPGFGYPGVGYGAGGFGQGRGFGRSSGRFGQGTGGSGVTRGSFGR